MAKGTRGRRRIASRYCRPTPYPMLTCRQNVLKDLNEQKFSMPKKDWEDVTCSVCMECPHNAVLLLCSSHDKGCRPFMCGTSSHYSNCLDQYKKAYTKVTSPHLSRPLQAMDDGPAFEPISGWPVEKSGELAELACPLCRGQVKGWTVVESARVYLNGKKRTCMHNNCSFVGAYKDLKKHVRSDHPSAKPREVDPDQEQKWRLLEREREREDVISTVTSSMPGSVVYGDYVIERNHHGLDSDYEGFDVDDLWRSNNGGLDVGIDGGNGGGLDVGIDGDLANIFLLFHAFGPGGNMSPFGGARRRDDHDHDHDSDDDDDDGDDNGMSVISRLHHQGRVILGRSGRRRRHREANRGEP